MQTQTYPLRGEVYFLPFESTDEGAMHGRHPALVVQNNKANRHSGVILIVPISTNLRVAQLPVGVKVDPPDGGLDRPSAIHCGQIHTVDRNEFSPQMRRGMLSPVTMQAVDKALKISLDLIF